MRPTFVLLVLIAFSGVAIAGECPNGRVAGAAPPDGYERGCEKQLKNREWVRHGQWTEWFMNGQKQKQGSYFEGRRSGFWIWWYPNGNKMQQGKFWDGRPSGKWLYWDERGKLANEPNPSATPKQQPEQPTADFDDFSKNLKKSFNK